MKTMISGFGILAAGATILPALLFASPLAKIDNADANLGALYEGQATSAKHVFKVKNTGDSVLKIFSVRPG